MKKKQRPLELRLEQLRDTVNALHDRVSRKLSEGKLKQFVGVRGHATLMHDKLQRFLENDKDNETELWDLAVDAVVAVYLITPEVDAMPQDAAADILRKLPPKQPLIEDDVMEEIPNAT